MSSTGAGGNYFVDCPADWHMECVSEIDSTNLELLRQIRQGVQKHIEILQADHQTNGRGTRGRKWLSVESSLTFSVAVPVKENLDCYTALPLVVGYHVVETLRDNRIPAQLKWPNDVLLYGRKLAGILVETAKDMSGRWVFVIGIGLNLRVGQASLMTDYDIAGVNEVPGSCLDKYFWLRKLTQAVVDAVSDRKSNGLSPIKEAWNKVSAYKGEWVDITSEDGTTYSAQILGIDDQGCLLVDREGSINKLMSGMVKIRKRLT